MTKIPEIEFYNKMFESYSIRKNFKKYDFKTFLKRDLERTISDLILRPIYEYKSFLERKQINRECRGLYNIDFYRPETVFDFFKQRAKTLEKYKKAEQEFNS